MVPFQFLTFILLLLFLRYETSLNFFNFDRPDFVEIQNFDGYEPLWRND